MNSVTEPQEKFLRLAVGQVKPSKPKCMLSSLTQLRNLAIEAKNSNSDVLILPELFLGGGYILHDIDKRAITSQSSEMKEAQKVAKPWRATHHKVVRPLRAPHLSNNL